MRLLGRSLSGRQRWAFLILAVYVLAAVELWLWLPPTPRATITLPQPGRPMALSRDGNALIVCSADDEPGSPHTLSVWDTLSGSMKCVLEGITDQPWDTFVGPEGSLVAAITCCLPIYFANLLFRAMEQCSG